jgi:septum site-determining protein MinD
MRTRVISIFSGKGGVGKSTVTSNIGASLASKYKKDVVIVDCNLTTSHLSLSLGMYYCPTNINHVLRGEKDIFDVLYQHPSGMRIAPASLSLKDLKNVDMSKLRDVLEDLKGGVDYVLLDTSPGLGRETYSAIHACDEGLIVTNPNIPAVADVIKCREILDDVNKKSLGVVLNMVNNKSYELSRKEVERLTGMPVLASVPHDRNIHMSLAKKMPVVMYKPNAKCSKEFLRVAGWLSGEQQRSLISRLFGI